MLENSGPQNIMEKMHDSAVIGMVESNMRTFEGEGRAEGYMGINLEPSYIKSDAGLLIGPHEQAQIAKKVLAGLQREWQGKDLFEYTDSSNPSLRLRYWGFDDVLNKKSVPCTVVECHDQDATPGKPAVSAFLVRGQRQSDMYRQLRRESNSTSRFVAPGIDDRLPQWKPEKRIARAAKAVGKILKGNQNTPPNRWY